VKSAHFEGVNIMQGTVLRYERAQGYGFILADDESLPDLFVHFSFIQANAAKRFLRAGQRVEFDYAEDDKGRPQARNVRVVTDSAPTARAVLSIDAPFSIAPKTGAKS
jgi:cold shock CspA family protein